MHLFCMQVCLCYWMGMWRHSWRCAMARAGGTRWFQLFSFRRSGASFWVMREFILQVFFFIFFYFCSSIGKIGTHGDFYSLFFCRLHVVFNWVMHFWLRLYSAVVTCLIWIKLWCSCPTLLCTQRTFKASKKTLFSYLEMK